MLRIIDYTAHTPALNLALEEAILNAVEAGQSPDTLRFWESPTPFVVLGVGQKALDEVNKGRCDMDGLPVLRRCSAGGCVIQGPGCLNFSLFLNYERWPDVRELRPSYCFILRAIVGALKKHGIRGSIEGTSDIAVDGRKISGNAQKRKKFAMMHHGTFLYGMTAEPMIRYLREPKMRPDYRLSRTHGEFVSLLPLTSDTLRSVVRGAFGGEVLASRPTPTELDSARTLAFEKYDRIDWTYRR